MYPNKNHVTTHTGIESREIICTVLPAKSDSDFMFCYQVVRNLESINYLCISPIPRIGLMHKECIDSQLSQVECES